LAPTGVDVVVTFFLNDSEAKVELLLATGLPASMEIEDDPFTLDSEFEAKSEVPP
jgi:hypothetical protein